MAGVSYFKTTAPPVIDLGDTATTEPERAFLARYYEEGLGEFAYRNQLDLRGLEVTGPDEAHPEPTGYAPVPGRPLIPFGGGIDSIVTVASIRPDHPDAALYIVHPPGAPFAAIEAPAQLTGLPIVHVVREIDPLVRRSDELGFLNGHVPVTAVIGAASLLAAVLHGHDAVILSNEWSASVPTLMHEGRPVNHQWSKGDTFEQAFAAVVRARLGTSVSVFSYLRPRSELWVAQQFSGLEAFHPVFRSCNRAFHQRAEDRLDEWCGRCDKCCFIDLILAPFMAADALAAVFTGGEPLQAPENAARFRTLLGLEPDAKPFECVGDVTECRAAVVMAAARPDRQHDVLLQVDLLDEVGPTGDHAPSTLLTPLGPHYIPGALCAS